MGLLAAFVIGLRLTRNRRRTYLYLELVLIPIALAVTIIGYPVAFIGIALGSVALIWVITAMASPRLVGPPRRAAAPQYPTIPCPACQTPNAVTTDVRPHRFNCVGCGRVIKLVA